MPNTITNPFRSMFQAARADGQVTRSELERIIAYANRRGSTDADQKALFSAMSAAQRDGKITQPALDLLTTYLKGDGVAAKGTAVMGRLDKALEDGKISLQEAKDLVASIKKFGVNEAERKKVSNALQCAKYKDAFEEGAAAELGKVGIKVDDGTPKPPPPGADYSETRRLLATVLSDGKLTVEEQRRVGGMIRKSGVTEGEQKALADAFKQNERRLDAAAAEWFKRFT